MPAKGQVKRTHCRIDGCPNPPHVYPSGARAAYCQTHIRLRKGKLRGKVNITYPMERILRTLRTALEQDRPFVLLDRNADYELDCRTLETLVERDWIVSGDVSAPFYRITKRGLDVLAQCDVRVVRKDGICPRCGERPKHIRASGRQDAYCDECESARAKVKEKKRRRTPPTDNCRHCHEHPRHQYQPSGTWSDYCAECDRMLRKLRKHTTAKEYRERIRQGVKPVPLCAACKERPVVLCENSVAHYCAVCRPKKTREWKVKRMYARIRAGTYTSLSATAQVQQFERVLKRREPQMGTD